MKRICQRCGAEFSAFPSHVARGQGKYCSPFCRARGSLESFERRFWSKVEKAGPVVYDRLGPCWVWNGARARRLSGTLTYGVIRHADHARRGVYAHRASYELAFGPIPEGLDVLHRCDNPPCVNPSHLFLGTQRNNIDDMVEKGRQTVGQRHPLAHLTPAQV